jgi:hypothetical protein
MRSLLARRALTTRHERQIGDTQSEAVEQPDEPDEARDGVRLAGFAGYPGVRWT